MLTHTCHVHVQSNARVSRVVYSVCCGPGGVCRYTHMLCWRHTYCSQLHVLLIDTCPVCRYTYCLEVHVLPTRTPTIYRYAYRLQVHVLFSRTRTVHTILDTLTLCTCCTRCTRFKYIYTFTHKFHNRKSTCSGTVIVVFVTSVVVRWHRGEVYRRGPIASQTGCSKPIYLEHALGSV